MTLDFDDEVCGCGHSKGYHEKTNIDNHGGACEKDGCLCELYTWMGFVKYTQVG